MWFNLIKKYYSCLLFVVFYQNQFYECSPLIVSTTVAKECAVGVTCAHIRGNRLISTTVTSIKERGPFGFEKYLVINLLWFDKKFNAWNVKESDPQKEFYFTSI